MGNITSFNKWVEDQVMILHSRGEEGPQSTYIYLEDISEGTGFEIR